MASDTCYEGNTKITTPVCGTSAYGNLGSCGECKDIMNGIENAGNGDNRGNCPGKFEGSYKFYYNYEHRHIIVNLGNKQKVVLTLFYSNIS